MQSSIRASLASRTAASSRTTVRCAAFKPEVTAVRRRDLLASGAAIAAALVAVAPVHAAGEFSATRAITNVTRPKQLEKKDENRKELKEQLQRVREGKEAPKF